MDWPPVPIAGPPGWTSLPGDLLLQVEAHLDDAHSLAAMRAVCAHWRCALVDAPARCQPLGKPAQLAAFPRAVELDFGARGAGQSLADGELLQAAALLGAGLTRLDVSGAFQLTTAGLQAALGACTALRCLAADGSTIQDDAFALQPPLSAASGGDAPSTSSGSGSGSGSGAEGSGVARNCMVLGLARSGPGSPLQCLERLSLRGCLFLRGSLLGHLAAACPRLSFLDLAGCGLALNLNPDTSALLPRLACLERLVLDGNQADDGALRHAAALPRLRELSVRHCEHLTDGGLRHLAQHRGSTVLARSTSLDGGGGEAGSGGEAGGSGGGSGRDVGLVALDISGCTGLADQCWVALTEMQGLTRLALEHMPHLLQFPSMPEALPPVLWRLPRLRALSLAGSCCHPSKLKLLGAACGGSVTHLDLSTGAAYRPAACTCGPCSSGNAGSSGGGGSGGGCSARPAWAAPPAAAAGAAGAHPPGPPYRRLTSLHERDLCEAAASFRQLRSFRAAGSALPLRVCTAFLAAAPAGRLEALDLSGCCLEAEHPSAEGQYGGTAALPGRQLVFSSGARRALNFYELPAVTGNSPSRLQQQAAERDSWERPATAGRFAAALRRQGPSLRALRLGGASGLKDAHLSSLRALQALTRLCLAGAAAAVSPTLLADAAAGCRRLSALDISGTAAGDACLAAAAAMPALCSLAAAGCSGVGAAGAAALAAGPAAASLRWLDLSQTGASDAAVAALAAGCGQLRGLQLTGCGELSPATAEQLCRLSALECLGLGRCPHALTDAALLQLARHLPLLTQLGLSEAQHVSAAGLAAALQRLPVLAHLDLTACSSGRLSDEQVLQALSCCCGGGDCGSGSPATPANIQLPQGGSSPTGSPLRRRRAGAA